MLDRRFLKSIWAVLSFKLMNAVVTRCLWSSELMAHGRLLSGMPGHVLSPKNCPFASGDLYPPTNTWFLKPTRAHNQNSISIGSAVFVQLTAVSSSMHRHVISPKICTSDRWSGPPSNIWFLGSIRLSSPNGISIVSAVFAQLKAHSHYTLQWATSFPKWPFPLVYLEHHLVRLLGPVRSHNPNGISIVSAVFAQLTAEFSYPLQWDAPFPQNCPFPFMGDLDSI